MGGQGVLHDPHVHRIGILSGARLTEPGMLRHRAPVRRLPDPASGPGCDGG
ncbi:MAG: hypothetical protein RMJ54_03465 [Roseiflexaceae bacterium]|nr:hypothetical protein [Roseiflexus sp.]MDW8231816.1 hypothetical protein [Roseiflexaceae bacterium]